MIQSVRVIGLGKVGELVATLLAEAGFTVTRLRRAAARPTCPFATAALDVRDGAALRAALRGARRRRVLPAVHT